MAQTLLDRGFKNVHALYGGLDAWQKAGYPVEPKQPAFKQESAGTRLMES